jgi:hypothetical protein
VQKSFFAVQGFKIGSKDRKSLALIIPAGIVREGAFSPSTIFAVSFDHKTKRILLEPLEPQTTACEEV